jgi:hypothetical protein
MELESMIDDLEQEAKAAWSENDAIWAERVESEIAHFQDELDKLYNLEQEGSMTIYS